MKARVLGVAVIALAGAVPVLDTRDDTFERLREEFERIEELSSDVLAEEGD